MATSSTKKPKSSSVPTTPEGWAEVLIKGFDKTADGILQGHGSFKVKKRKLKALCADLLVGIAAIEDGHIKGNPVKCNADYAKCIAEGGDPNDCCMGYFICMSH